MQTVRAVVSCEIADSARVQQVGGMFDCDVPGRMETAFQAEIPGMDEDWRIGAIVGPSGSGKSSIAREAFGKALVGRRAWPRDKAIVDCFGNLPIKTITDMLTAVGFSSPPAWIRPYTTLSNGEQFRADLARALLSGGELVAYDEFSSVVDRQVAQIGIAAVSKSVRKGIVQARFVAVCCHYDILPWLEPDWVLDTASYTLCRRRLRRPPIRLEISRCVPDAWSLFRRHHYLSAKMCRRGVRCFLGTVEERPVAFAAILSCPGLTGAGRISRVVVLPDWQGVGIGRAFCAAIGQLFRDHGRTLHIRTSHQMMIRCLRGDTRWRAGPLLRYGSPSAIGDLMVTRIHGYNVKRSGHDVSKRPGQSFAYVGQPGKKAEKADFYQGVTPAKAKSKAARADVTGGNPPT